MGTYRTRLYVLSQIVGLVLIVASLMGAAGAAWPAYALLGGGQLALIAHALWAGSPDQDKTDPPPPASGWG